MGDKQMITTGPLAGYTVSSITLSDVFTASELYVLAINERGELGYLAAQQEWVDDHGDPLQEAEQWAANGLARDGFLPQFSKWFPQEDEGGENGDK